MTKLVNTYDAYVLALVLAISAKSEKDPARALALARDFAGSLTARQQARGRKKALQLLGSK